MGDEPSPDSPLERAAGAAGPRATEAFSILGNETRLSILLALWEHHEPFTEDTAVSFSELRELVGTRDSGQFNYHLNKLDGEFIRGTDDGYELRTAGRRIVRSVIAGTGIDDPTVDPAETGRECPLCGGRIVRGYEDGQLYTACSECEGNYGESEIGGEQYGMFGSMALSPAGTTDRSLEQMWWVGRVQVVQQITAAVMGVCSACDGPMERWLDVCEDHDDDGTCPTCGRLWAAAARVRCQVCKNSMQAPLRTAFFQHPRVVAFHHDHDLPVPHTVDLLDGTPDQDESWTTDQELLSAEPPRAQVTFESDGDRLELVVDDELAVIDVTESN